ncbi:MAG: hypothetical protein MI866_05335, partial [Bacteroidales bacterium]|nr:hypothetical protein [Bacteroidales bacterium]
MKTYTIFGLFIILLLSGCSSSQWVDSSYYDDDLYYTPKSKPVVVDDSYAPIEQSKELKKEDRKEFNQLKSEYNKSELAVEDNRNFSQIQSDYLGLLSNDSISQMDTLVYYNEETGYWVDGFDGSSMDQDYAERLIKFHGPFNGIPYWSPLYNDMVYFNYWDWNVYVDGDYAYAFPTWSNPWYHNYRYNDGFN